MALRRLKTLYVAAENVSETAAFYRDVLGFGMKFADGDRWVQLALGGQSVAIASRDESAIEPPGWVPVFEAENEEDHGVILAGGGRLLDERDMGDHGRTRTYADPAGAIFQCWWPAA